MTRRMFYIALGATVGILVVRKASQVASRYTPSGMQHSMAGALAGLSEAIRSFGEDVREGMAEREELLRSELGLDGRHDVVDS